MDYAYYLQHQYDAAERQKKARERSKAKRHSRNNK